MNLNGKTASELIELIKTELGDDDKLYNKMIHIIEEQNADSSVLDAAYEKIKNNCNEYELNRFAYYCIIRRGKKVEPTLLIKIINETKDKNNIFEAMRAPKADSSVLDAAYERVKNLFGVENNVYISLVIDDIVGRHFHTNKRKADSEKAEPTLLIKIINETENEEIIFNAMEAPKADSSVLDAAYERTKILSNVNIFKNVVKAITGDPEFFRFGYFDCKRRASCELLIKIINETENEEIKLHALQHKNATAQMIYNFFEGLNQESEMRKKCYQSLNICIF